MNHPVNIGTYTSHSRMCTIPAVILLSRPLPQHNYNRLFPERDMNIVHIVNADNAAVVPPPKFAAISSYPLQLTLSQLYLKHKSCKPPTTALLNIDE